MYYAFSRPIWIMGVFAIVLAIFLGKFGIAKAFLGGNNMRVLGKSIIIGCVIEILIIESLFTGMDEP